MDLYAHFYHRQVNVKAIYVNMKCVVIVNVCVHMVTHNHAVCIWIKEMGKACITYYDHIDVNVIITGVIKMVWMCYGQCVQVSGMRLC